MAPAWKKEALKLFTKMDRNTKTYPIMRNREKKNLNENNPEFT